MARRAIEYLRIRKRFLSKSLKRNILHKVVEDIFIAEEIILSVTVVAVTIGTVGVAERERPLW